MAYPVKITAKVKKDFLRLLSETGNVFKCCVALRICRPDIYNLRRKNKEFKAKWETAVRLSIALIEDEAWRRAFEGLEKDVWYKGKVVGTERVYSDTLLMNRLQAELPEKYQYRQKVEHSGNLALNINVEFIKPEADDTNG